MSYFSFHITIGTLGGNYAMNSGIQELLAMAKWSDARLSKENYNNAGCTKWDERNVLAAYIKAGGVALDASDIVGYSRHPDAHGAESLKDRLIRSGPHKMRQVHTAMKRHHLQTHKLRAAFYVFERLLQLYFDDYEATVPPRLTNWAPSLGSIYYHPKWDR